MKKVKYIVISAVVASVVSGMFVFSAPQQIPNMCPLKPYPVSNFFTRTMQGILGLNYSSSKIAEHEIKTQIAKTVSGDIDIKITPYSALDLIGGKFKSAEVKAKNVNLDGISISSFEAKSLCDFVYIDYKKNPVTPIAPALIGFKGTVTQDDFNKTLSSPQYSSNLTKIKARISNTEINLVDFINPKINIADGSINLTTQMHFAGLPSYLNIPVKIGTGLKVENNKIKLTNLKVLQEQGLNMPIVANLVQAMSPAIVDLNNIGIKGSKITLKDLTIHDDKIDVSGTIWVPGK